MHYLYTKNIIGFIVSHFMYSRLADIMPNYPGQDTMNSKKMILNHLLQ